MPDEARIRILICHSCHSIQPLPWYEGNPENDDTLNFRVAEHRFPDGNEHFGIMATVLEKEWDNLDHRDEIVKKIQEASVTPGSGAGMGETYYDIKSNFSEDAMKCWTVDHNRTKNCGDYRSDKKRLYPDTKAERKSEGLPARRPNTFLCDFCPYHQIVEQRQGSEEFGYNYDE